MGICVQKTTSNFKELKPSRNTSKESFLYSSFTYDPTYCDDSNFFYFDIPHYCEIQYILRKNCSSKELAELQTSIEQHLQEIESALSRLQDKNFMPGSSLTEPLPFKKKEEATYESTKKEEESLTSQPSDLADFSNILNLEVFSVNLDECQQMQDLPFHVALNETKVITINGNVTQNKWKPTSNNKISVPNTLIELQNMKQESKIKISTQLQGKELECTIPCNKIVFKYIIPVLQSSNLRGKEDNQPLGHVHFKIEYVGDFEEHKKNVVMDLVGRRNGLASILSRIRKQQDTNEKSLIIEEHDQSFRSDLKQE